MILDEESWMNVRRFRALHERGTPLAEIARECRCDWRTVKKYLAQDGLVGPPKPPSRAGTQPRLIDPYVAVVETWLRADITIKGAVVHERPGGGGMKGAARWGGAGRRRVRLVGRPEPARARPPGHW